MKILFVSTYFRLFDAIDCGAANRSTMFVKALARIGHVDVISFYKEPLKSNIEDCEVIFSSEVKNENNNRQKKSFLNKIKERIDVFNPYNYYEINKKQEAIIDEFVLKGNYDIIACRYLWQAIPFGLLKYSNKLVIDEDDGLAAAMKRDLAVRYCPHFWSKADYIFRAHAIGWMAKNVLRKILCTFHSNRLSPPCSDSVLLHNVTLRNSPLPKVTEQTPIRLLIIGWMEFFPNIWGMKHFVENIFPEIRMRIPAVELHIVGKMSNKELKKEVDSIPGVTVMGYVDDIETEYCEARICVVPIYHGAGTSVKFIEGLSMGRMVVSTPMGARGCEDVCQNGRDYALASSDQEFIDKISSLLLLPDKINQIADNGYKIASRHFSHEAFCNTVKTAITKRLH